MHQSLAVKYRPQTFEEVCGQSTTVTILKQAIIKGTFKNAYLFAGDSGCGKTTLARLFAKEINHGVGTPIEIDAASNNGVDNVRSIMEEASQRSLDSEYKIFIIDECHSITAQGWQAFLKGIEEPPAYTIFMFCTTEPSKIPETILNRVQRYNIVKIDNNSIYNRLKYICEQEGFSNYDTTCDLLSKVTNGCMRDAITYLEQCASYSTDLSLENAKRVVSQLSYEPMFKLMWGLIQKDDKEVLNTVNGLYANGVDLKAFVDSFLNLSINILKYALFDDISVTNIPAYLATEDNPVVQHTIKLAENTSWFNKLIDTLLSIKLEIKYDPNSQLTLAAFLLRLCRQ